MLKTKTPELSEIQVSHFNDLPVDTVNYLKTYFSSSDAYFFAKTSKHFRQQWLNDHKDKALGLKELFQAIIDDHQDTVKKILDKDPWLLLETPGKNQILKSEFTHQIFNVGGFTGLQITLLRDQLEMTKLILFYFHQITEGHQEALRQWKACDVIKETKKESIKAYRSKMKILIEDIAGKTKNKFDEIDFRMGYLPKEKTIRLDTYENIEALLLSAYQAYDDYYEIFKYEEQRDEFCIKVIGFLQSLLSPETAKVFCEGIYYVVEEGTKPVDVAKPLKLVNEPNVLFYRLSGDSSEGLGFDFFIDDGAPATQRIRRDSDVVRWMGLSEAWRGPLVLFGKLCQSKTYEFCQLKDRLKAGHLPTLELDSITSRFCLIQ